jgi:hypothetical protein
MRRGRRESSVAIPENAMAAERFRAWMMTASEMGFAAGRPREIAAKFVRFWVNLVVRNRRRCFHSALARCDEISQHIDFA